MKLRAFIPVVLLLVLATEPARAGRLAVIVHAERSAQLDVEAIAQIYLKRRRYWSGGDLIVPVNREAGSRARDDFTRRVLKLGPTRLGAYWNREYFLGVLPPATLASDEAVLRYVARDRRAIGYVDESVIDDSVRVVLFLDLE
jgi:ABC-type phosphate transport system substrate-binding protein